MSTAARYIPTYTVADYQSWYGDWELWDGVAISMGPSPFGSHQNLALRIGAELLHVVSQNSCCDFTVLQEIDWIINEFTVVRPDIVVLAGGVPEKHVESPPAIAIEILSESTNKKDRQYKFDLYQSVGVQYYVIADPTEKRLEIFQLIDNIYQPQTVASNFEFELSSSCKIEINTQRIIE